MVRFQNLDFAIEALNIKQLKSLDTTYFFTDTNIKKFNWGEFFNCIFNKNLIKYTQYSSSTLKQNSNQFSLFCNEINARLIIYGKNAYNDYDMVGILFNDTKQKLYFLVKYGGLIHECTH